ncbi:MAG: hypothetical protein WC271_00640 [Bacteroidales bacterium]|jgi:hypothetical protein|nr:hypothetical protein [Bacteroidales bacterium]NCU35585.1 hypothetical protein [Candidatus Falkowbacteria bacterium]
MESKPIEIQLINSSTHQHISTSSHQHINTSPHQHIITSSHQQIMRCVSPMALIFRFAPCALRPALTFRGPVDARKSEIWKVNQLKFNSSPNQHIPTSAHHHISTSACVFKIFVFFEPFQPYSVG